MSQTPQPSDQSGLPTKEETDRLEVNDRSPDTTESAEAIGWKEVKLTLATLVFFGVPLLIASAQITANYHLSHEFPKQADNSYVELILLHWSAVVVTGIGLLSAILIVATSFIRVGANFIRTWKEIRSRTD